MQKLRVAVLRGGPDDERAISLQSGAGVLAALHNTEYIPKDIVITKAGEWITDGYVRAPYQALMGSDVVFNALHGTYGEGGEVQRLLNRTAIPYTGSKIYASSASINKPLAKTYAQRLGMLTPRHFRIKREAVHDPYALALQVAALFGPEFIVKPSSSGSSIGVYHATGPAELADVLLDALFSHDDILIEERIIGKEVSCGLIERIRDNALYDLPLTEVIPPSDRAIYDVDTKYSSKVNYSCPATLSRSEKAEVVAMAKQLHRALGLSQYSLSDFIISNRGIYYLETNALPGLTPHSIIPKAAGAVGMGYVDLVKHLIQDAAERRY